MAEQESIDLHVHLVSPLIHYFPLYLALGSPRPLGLRDVLYHFSQTDEHAVTECANGAQESLAKDGAVTSLHIALTSPDMVDRYNASTKNAEGSLRMSSLYPLIVRAPVWCYILGKTGWRIESNSHTGTTSLQPAIIDQLKSLSWYTYPKETTTYNVAVHQLGITSIADTPVQFGEEFRDERLKKQLRDVLADKAEPFGILSLNPWDFPRTELRHLEQNDWMQIYPLTGMLYPFTNICIPDNYRTGEAARRLQETIFTCYLGQVQTFYAANQLDIANIKFRSIADLIETDLVDQLRHYAGDSFDKDQPVSIAPIVDGYVKMQKKELDPSYRVRSAGQPLPLRVSCRRAAVMFHIAKCIVDIYVSEAKRDASARNEWLMRLPDSLTECLITLGSSEVFPFNELKLLWTLGFIPDDQLKTADRVEHFNLHEDLERMAQAQAHMEQLKRFEGVEDRLNKLIENIRDAYTNATVIDRKIGTSGNFFLRWYADPDIQKLFDGKSEFRTGHKDDSIAMPTMSVHDEESFSEHRGEKTWKGYQNYLRWRGDKDELDEPLFREAADYDVQSDEQRKKAFRLLKCLIAEPHRIDVDHRTESVGAEGDQISLRSGRLHAIQLLGACMAVQKEQRDIFVGATDYSVTGLDIPSRLTFAVLAESEWNEPRNENHACVPLPAGYYPTDFLRAFMKLLHVELVYRGSSRRVEAHTVSINNDEHYLQILIACDGVFADPMLLIPEEEEIHGLRYCISEIGRACNCPASIQEISSEGELQTRTEKFIIAGTGDEHPGKTWIRIRFEKKGSSKRNP